MWINAEGNTSFDGPVTCVASANRLRLAFRPSRACQDRQDRSRRMPGIVIDRIRCWFSGGPGPLFLFVCFLIFGNSSLKATAFVPSSGNAEQILPISKWYARSLKHTESCGFLFPPTTNHPLLESRRGAINGQTRSGNGGSHSPVGPTNASSIQEYLTGGSAGVIQSACSQHLLRFPARRVGTEICDILTSAHARS